MEFVPTHGPDQPTAVRPEPDRWVNSRTLRYRARDEASAQAWARYWTEHEGTPSTVDRDHLGWYVDADLSATIQREGWPTGPHWHRNHLERRAD